MHDLIFAQQDTILGLNTVKDIDTLLAKEISPTEFNWETLQRCMDQPESVDAIKAQAKQGALVNVQGTPAIYANGRALNRGQMLPVLQAAYGKSKDQDAKKGKN